jgi:glucose-1-phosphate cytidylyltransferase
MKVVLFCGGMGMRIREFSDNIPKPMVPVGNRPILWNIMRYYAHYGHKDFILCLGYKGEVIKEYFLNYRETFSNDFVLSHGGKNIELLNSDIHDWKITFVDTGLKSNIGMRLKAAENILTVKKNFLQIIRMD